MTDRIARTCFCGLLGLQLGMAAPGSAFGTDLDTDPAGTHVILRGPVSVEGRAPVPIDELPEGDYDLTTEGPGLATARGRFRLSGEGLQSRGWAGPGSLFIPPGVVHLDRGERRGWIYLTAAVGSGALAFVANTALGDAEDDFELAELEYARAVTEEDLADARGNVLVAAQDKEDQGEIRNLWSGYLAATWIAAGVESWLLTAEPTLVAAETGHYVLTVPRAGGWHAAARSAIVPGAGQRFMGRHGRGNMFAAAFCVGTAGAILAHENFLEARRDQLKAQADYDQAETEEALERTRAALEKAAADVDDKTSLRWAMVGVTAGVYLWNVFDAFAAGGQDNSSGLSWSATPAQDGFLTAVSWSVR